MVGQDTPWIHNVKNDGAIAATGSLGMIYMWDIDGGANEVAEYINTQDGFVKSGAYMAIGLFNSGVINENDPAKALLSEPLSTADRYF